MMKIFSTLFLSAAIALVSCGAGNGSDNGNSGETEAETVAVAEAVSGATMATYDENGMLVEQLPPTVAAPKESKVQYISEAEFKTLVFDYIKNTQTFVYEGGTMPCIVDFYADWCGPCKRLAPILDDLSWEYRDKVKFYKVNTDKNREISSVFQIKSIPTLMYVNKKGELLGIQPGMPSREQLVQLIEQHLIK